MIVIKDNAGVWISSQINLLPTCAKISQIKFAAVIFAQILTLLFGMEDLYEL